MINVGGPNIFIACMWRSGSTHIATALSRLLNWRPATTAGFHGEGMEQQIINPFSSAILFPYGFQVFQQHTLGTPRNIDLLRNFGIRPIVTIRPFPDILISLKEKKDSDPEKCVIPGLVFPRRWGSMSDEEKYRWLAYTAGAWLNEFKHSWDNANIPKLFVNYDDFYKDQVSGVKRILKHVGVSIPPDDNISRFTSKKLENYFNVGEFGRGKKLLPDSAWYILEAQETLW